MLPVIVRTCHFWGIFFCIKNSELAWAGVAQWIEYWHVNCRVTSSIPSQGTCPGGRSVPQLGAWERQPIDFLTQLCMSPSFPPFPSL